jgi:hypothetical protein
MSRRNRKLKPGRALEKLVASLERALGGKDGVKVESPKYLPDRVTGELRELDVVITFPTTHHEMTLAIECRDRSRKVTVNDVEAFFSKCQDTKAHKGVIVSPKGFSKPALSKAKNCGIACLSLLQVESFNWLLAPGIQSRNRRILTTHWTLIPEKNLVPKPTSFAVVDPNGKVVPPEAMFAAARQEFSKLPDQDFEVGRAQKKILFQSPGIFLRDDATGTVYPIVKAVAEIEYEVTEEFVPFNLMKYTDSDSGALITDAAVAEVDFGTVSGRLRQREWGTPLNNSVARIPGTPY